VKLFRLFVLLLVALLLPIRGVVAASMDCGAGAAGHAHAGFHGGTMDGIEGHGHQDHGDGMTGVDSPGAHTMANEAVSHAAHGAHGDGHEAAVDGAGGDTCHLCASGCGVAVLLTAMPGMVGEPPTCQAPLPGVTVPALEFQLDGQDRPPRTI
jgi:hypothetical protein